jgi:thioredoxin-like negative regulator of GroEL
MEHYQVWRGVYDRVIVPGWALEAFMRSPVRKLLVIAADWCGDAANTVPVLARLAELVRGMELRVLERDSFPEAMAAYLTNGTRSIPIVVALTESAQELGHWGPRPAALQAWVTSNKKMIPSPQRYVYARKWYAKDKGETTLRELLAAVT